MRHLHRHGRTIENDNFVAPVKLIGFAGIKAQRHIRRSRGFPRRLRPVGSIATHSIVAAIITPAAQHIAGQGYTVAPRAPRSAVRALLPLTLAKSMADCANLNLVDTLSHRYEVNSVLKEKR